MDQIGMTAGTGVPRGVDTRAPGTSIIDRSGRRSVRPVVAPVERTCARPSCAAPAQATLAFAYGDRVAMLAPLASDDIPQSYDLCGVHASRTRAPRGWSLEDRRVPEDQGVAGPPPMSTDLGDDRTVAVLAAALRAVPDPVSEDAVGAVAEVGRTSGRGGFTATRAGADRADDPSAADGLADVGPRPGDRTEAEAVRPVTRPPLALRTRDGA